MATIPSASGSGVVTQKPSFQSIPQQSLFALQGKAKEAAQRAANPLSDPAAQQTLQAIQSQLNRRQQQGIAQAKSRGATSGQAGFQGALASTAAGLEADNRASYADASANLALQLAQQARAAELAYEQAAAQSESESNRLGIQKYGVDADINKTNATLAQRQSEVGLEDARERARLAEQARQFDVKGKSDESQFARTLREQQAGRADQTAYNTRLLDLREKESAAQRGDLSAQLKEQARQFNLAQAQQGSQFDRSLSEQQAQRKTTTAQNQRNLDLRQQEADFQRAKEQLQIAQAAAAQGFLGADQLSAQYGQVANVATRPLGAQRLINVGGRLIDPSTFQRF